MRVMSKKTGLLGFIGVFLLLLAILVVQNLPMSAMSTISGVPDVSNKSIWGLTFSDNFSGTQLDAGHWVTCYDSRQPGDNGCTNTGNGEQEWYMASQVSVTNGHAVLTAIRKPVKAIGNGGGKIYQYRSGMISTGRMVSGGKVKWASTYGYYVARIKMDGGQGVWPAFWLLPANGSWPPEIDIMEHLGDQPNRVFLTVHWLSSTGYQADGSAITGPDFTNGWHTYAVNWQPNRIDWYVDGVLRKTVRGSVVPHKSMEMIFDLAIGGRLPGDANRSTPFPRTMQIDYVKVYERKTH